MKKIKQIVGTFSILAMLLLPACTPVAAPAPAPAPAAPAPAPAPAQVLVAPAAPAKPAWQIEWETVLAAAGGEGKVVVYTSAGGLVPRVMADAFRKKHGIVAEFVAGTGTLMVTRILNERRAGLNLADVYSAGPTSTVNLLKPAGVFEDLRTAFILPEFKDPKVWYGGRIPWIDNEQQYMLGYTAYPLAVLLINTDMVKPEEVMSYRDLLNPKWKGKLLMPNPTIAGVGSAVVRFMFDQIGEDYLRALAKQELTIVGDQRLVVEWVARGKHPISIAPLAYIVDEFQKAGAHIKAVTPKEGTLLSPGSASLSLFKNAPHPNAAKVYINWLLTREGQSVYAKVYNAQSAREDVSTEGLDPAYVRQPGVKYIIQGDENFIKGELVLFKKAKEVFADYLK